MKTTKASSIEELPAWVNECISFPQKGVLNFLQELCNIGNAPYAHIRVRSRSGKFYKLAESIGPYKTIGWQRRFQLIDKKENHNLSYQFVDYTKSKDCEALKNKFEINSPEYKYLNSLVCGFWIPLKIKDIDLGYVTLSWNTEPEQENRAVQVKSYIQTFSEYIPLVYQACRNIIADRYLVSLWSDAAVILSATNEHECYDRIADACIKLWGNDTSIYIGKVADEKTHFEVITVAGRRANEAKRNIFTHNIPINKGIFGYLYKKEETLLSYSIPNDRRFKYHSMREDGKSQGSVIAARISDSSNKIPFAFISVEHELESYFDNDDIRYITGIASIGYENIMAHRSAAERRSRDFDALFTQVSHDVVEPLQALVADAEVLKYETTNALSYLYKSVDIEKYLSDTLLRVTNFLDEALNLNKIMWSHLDAGIDGISTRIKEGAIRIFPMMNTLVDTWRKRAESQGIEIRCLYDSLREIKVSCDEAELKSAIGHLIGNAIKYSFWGRMQHQGSQSKYGRYVSIIGRVKMGMAIIEFQNYGIGILSNEFNLVTEKYYRGKLAIKEGKAGTGRGLWSAKKFLEGAGGYLTITSMPKGSDIDGPYSTSVYIHLPIMNSKESKNG
ncbi:MAG: HAMP domain-containing histidine kinase [Chloroflexi bacterium]|nr:HAMP domain-containing histidine kinase [Chloroflexota bacterium]